MATAEQIEKWRSEFEQLIDNKEDLIRHPTFTDCYWFDDMQKKWQGFLMARESVVIELPLKPPITHDDGEEKFFADGLDTAQEYIESQGYNVNRGE